MNILMPESGSLVKWHCAEGATVRAGAVVCEVETDKTVMEVEAPETGVLARILVREGQTGIEAGQTLAVMDAAGAVQPDRPAELAPLRRSALAPEVAAMGRIASSPLARRLAQEAGLELSHIKGSGPGGRIVERDVQGAAAAHPASGAGVAGDYAGCAHEVRPIDAMRRTIAQRLLASKQNIPHFYLSCDVRADALLALRRRLQSAQGSAPTVNDFLVKAQALALLEVAEANVVWAEDSILSFRQVDVGVAVAVDGGLYTPVVRHADAKSVFEISQEIRGLAERARRRELQPVEYRGGVTTVSNLGMLRVPAFSAIINPPQSSILAVGACGQRIGVVDGAPAVVQQMTVTLSCDHRVIDGTVGARCLEAFRRRIEAPEQLLP